MASLEYLTDDPLNAAVPLSDLDSMPLSQDRVYLRNSFPAPPPGEVTGVVEVGFPGANPWHLTIEDLADLERVELDLVLECAGNGRSLIRPAVKGLAWGFGGVSPIRVEGVRLRDALGEIPVGIVELVMTGADRGRVKPEGTVNYQFSVSNDLVRDGTALLVTGMGGEPLGRDHGGPIRFMLPGHYAMKSVKWLTRIEGVTEPFRGHFVKRYRYLGEEPDDEGSPVAEIRVRSIIARPGSGHRLPAGMVEITGSAWSGTGPVKEVEVSADDGETWARADLAPGESPVAAASWSIAFDLAPGRHTVMARATDAAGNTQPLEPIWNRMGYGNNLVHRVSFETG